MMQARDFMTPHIQKNKSKEVWIALEPYTFVSPHLETSPLMISEESSSKKYHKSFAKYTECTICLLAFTDN
jgi:hypothetical protein